MDSPPQLPASTSGLSAVLPWLGAVMTGLVGWSAARYTAFAQLNKTVLDASRELVENAQTIHARDGARILELEAEILRMRGEVNSHIQREHSLEHMVGRLTDELEERIKEDK